MKILITAGSTQVMIDKVRAITNIFRGRTGRKIAAWFDSFNNSGLLGTIVENEIVLLISNPEAFFESDRIWTYAQYRKKKEKALQVPHNPLSKGKLAFAVVKYRTFDELAEIMENEIRTGNYDVVIHSAAVSDYEVSGVFERGADERLTEVDSRAKISSKHGELFLRMTPTFKIVDKIRSEWGFKGKLIKFKLEVGKSDDELIEIAKKSCAASDADLIVANCLEWARERAFIIDRDGGVENVTRDMLAERMGQKLEPEKKEGGFEGSGRQWG